MEGIRVGKARHLGRQCPERAIQSNEVGGPATFSLAHSGYSTEPGDRPFAFVAREQGKLT